MFKYLVFGFALLSVSAMSCTKNSASSNDSGSKPGVQREQLSCTENSECVKVKGDCCGCSAGGTAAVINSHSAKEYEERNNKDCSGIVCAQAISNHPSCAKTPVCNKGLCELE